MFKKLEDKQVGVFSNSHLRVEPPRCVSLSSACSRLVRDIKSPLFLLLLFTLCKLGCYSCFFDLEILDMKEHFFF